MLLFTGVVRTQLGDGDPASVGERRTAVVQTRLPELPGHHATFSQGSTGEIRTHTHTHTNMLMTISLPLSPSSLTQLNSSFTGLFLHIGSLSLSIWLSVYACCLLFSQSTKHMHNHLHIHAYIHTHTHTHTLEEWMKDGLIVACFCVRDTHCND